MANVKKGDTDAIVGNGAAGVCAINVSKRLGVQRVIALSENPSRQKVA
jgi:threonine dehydrogenase-like Zn-dependent dehydrogenase